MTTRTVLTLSAAERAYLQAAVQCLMAVQAKACASACQHPQSPDGVFAVQTEGYALAVTPLGFISTLDHEEAAELMCLLGEAADVELHVPADPDSDDEPIGLEAAFVDVAAAAHCRL